MAHLRRAALREQTRMADATRAAGLVKEDFKAWCKGIDDALEG
jgi:hypothetical protein